MSKIEVAYGAGSGGSGSTEFLDTEFRINDDADPTKQLAFENSTITTATTITWTASDHDIDFNLINPAKGGALSVFIGANSGTLYSSGANACVAIGNEALKAATTAPWCVAIGNQALNRNTSGQSNTAVGYRALFLGLTSHSNTGIGREALWSSTAGNGNTAIGRQCLPDSNGGDYNTAIGYNTGAGITTGDYNTIIGAQVAGLSAGTANNIIIADGQGNASYWDDATNTTITKPLLSVKPIINISATGTADATMHLINCTANTFTYNLPTAVGIDGKEYIVKNSGAGVITVDADGAETIDGGLTAVLNQYDSITIVSDGANWIII